MAEGGGSAKGGVLGLIIGSLLAIGGGFGFGALLLKKPPQEAVAAAHGKEGKEGKEAKEGKEGKAQNSEVLALAPIVTNLGNPPDLFIRLQAAIAIAPNTPESNALSAKVGDDLVAYLRTVSLSEFQGPTGFQYLREDLRKRAIQLGNGKIRDFFVTSFVVE
jgi:flagellar protein FliL